MVEIKLCGVGGQGMGVAGRLLGEAAILSGLHVTETTAYGVESRGGLSTADVIISPEPILFPEVRRPDAVLLMADKGLKANLRGVLEATIILLDPGTVKEAINSPGKKLLFPFLEIALRELNDRETAGTIALGALVEITQVVPFDFLEAAVKKSLPQKIHEGNIRALRIGRELILGGCRIIPTNAT